MCVVIRSDDTTQCVFGGRGGPCSKLAVCRLCSCEWVSKCVHIDAVWPRLGDTNRQIKKCGEHNRTQSNRGNVCVCVCVEKERLSAKCMAAAAVDVVVCVFVDTWLHRQQLPAKQELHSEEQWTAHNEDVWVKTFLSFHVFSTQASPSGAAAAASPPPPASSSFRHLLLTVVVLVLVVCVCVWAAKAGLTFATPFV